ncbi:MAG: hypothetical protein DRJ03_01130 [Chloroflexi bacterium]|nr:MAG: hypothetical protein DRJ03_01130 [Chloroflexota bacterium]
MSISKQQFEKLITAYECVEPYLHLIFQEHVPLDDPTVDLQVQSPDPEDILHLNQCYEKLSTNAKDILDSLVFNWDTDMIDKLKKVRVNGNILKGNNLDLILTKERVLKYLKGLYGTTEALRVYREISNYFKSI